jgi:hypothetical protein
VVANNRSAHSAVLTDWVSSVRRPRCEPWERRLLSSIAVRWSALQNAILVVNPATLLRWHRTAWCWWWRRKSKRPPGRPLRSLVRRLWRENTTWGQTTIAAECGELGSTVSPRTVAKYRAQSRLSDLGLRLPYHRESSLQLLYGFVILAPERRQIMHVGVTAHPTAEWQPSAWSKRSATACLLAFPCTIAMASMARRLAVV